tara:strand:+ start:147 stop:608 length:462 start_codon:yes stop_codon:yes gene_type:complete
MKKLNELKNYLNKKGLYKEADYIDFVKKTAFSIAIESLSATIILVEGGAFNGRHCKVINNMFTFSGNDGHKKHYSQEYFEREIGLYMYEDDKINKLIIPEINNFINELNKKYGHLENEIQYRNFSEILNSSYTITLIPTSSGKEGKTCDLKFG